MIVDLKYGREGLAIRLPDTADVLATSHIPGIEDESEAIRLALHDPNNSLPLTSLVKPGNRVVVVHTDITRATPNDRILPVLIEELLKAGFDYVTDRDEVKIFRKRK